MRRIRGTVLLQGEAAFDQFYAQTSRRTLAVAASLTGDWAAAEDLTQDAYLAAHRRWAEVSAYDDPGAWVRRLVVNRATSRWRRRGREVRALARVADGARELIELETLDIEFWRAVRSLPPQQARAIVLRYVDDLSVESVAQVLGCSDGAAKSHLHRARATLFVRLGAHTTPTEADHV